MSSELRCSACQSSFRVPDEDKGKRIRCPRCGQIVAAAGNPSPANADLLGDEIDIPLGPTRVAANAVSAAGSQGANSDKSAVDPASLRSSAGEQMPASLPGYQILQELGRGGMGRVFLARQKSLDRLVALKVMHPRRAKDPTFVERFTLEAYTAAKLVHHNVIQIYDFDAAEGVHYFTMEYVKGETLTDLVKRQGKLDPELAAGYILQAARGLKFGHDLGMVHRDVKPDNLLVNDQGIIKVADLGLVKLPYAEEASLAGVGDDEREAPSRSTEMTRVGVGVGTPLYMAPEQARDATHVDARADIYSLGCTLYALLAGQPPFQGKTAAEILAKHASAPFVPTESFTKRVPKGLTAIVSKMLAKKPDDRFTNMGEVIVALERFLGIQQAAFTPREEHAQLLEKYVAEFNEAPHARLRTLIVSAFLGSCAVLLLLCLVFGWLMPAGILLGFLAMTPLAHLLIHGWRERTFLFLSAREWFAGMNASELLLGISGAAALILVLYLFNVLWLWMLVGLLSLGLAVAFYVLIDRRLARQRRPAHDGADKLVRTLRRHGVEERALQHFVCKYAGGDWEEFFEDLFGYPAKLKARAWVRGDAVQSRRRHGAWRDPIILWIDARLKARKKARERAQIQAVEAKALEAKGIGEAEAGERAARVADVIVAQAAQVEQDLGDLAAAGPTAVIPVAAIAPVAESASPPAAPVNFQKLLETARNPETTASVELPARRTGISPGALAAGLVSARFRFLIGAVLCFCCIFWIRQNHLLDSDAFSQAFAAMVEQGNTERWDRFGEPLAIPLCPASVKDLFNSFNVGIAGLVLLSSGFLGGWKAGLIAWPAAGLILLGSAVLPAAGPVSGGVLGLTAGLMLAAAGLLIRRWRRRSLAARGVAPAPDAA
jgi:predicted Zn finger-like uncharacterized protein